MNTRVDICCIVKNEHKFIAEWVKYHIDLGIHHIYIYEDYTSKSHKDVLSEFIDKGVITIIPLVNNTFGIKNYNCCRTQITVYKTHLQRCKDENLCDWCGFFDIDEFLAFEEGYDLQKLVDEYNDYPTILLCWKMYNANGRIKSPHPELGVVEAYPNSTNLRCDIDRWSIKSLANVRLVKNFLTLHETDNGKCTNGKHYDKGGMRYEKAWINHYFTKSFEDFAVRIFERGNMQNDYRSLDNFFYT